MRILEVYALVPPQTSSNYPPIFEDPQMGGTSNTVPEIDTTPTTFVPPPPPPPPVGYENPIPAYQDTAGYNPFEPQAYTGYNYQAPAVDPYVKAANFNALCPSPFPPAYQTGYPTYGYEYPPPQAQHQPQPPPQQPQTQEILQRLEEVEQRAEECEKKTHKFLKGLANFIKGKKKDR
ncbi:hypothetical protein Hanom_Chr13g01186501 [Helianthus anomalus]